MNIYQYAQETNLQIKKELGLALDNEENKTELLDHLTNVLNLAAEFLDESKGISIDLEFEKQVNKIKNCRQYCWSKIEKTFQVSICSSKNKNNLPDPLEEIKVELIKKNVPEMSFEDIIGLSEVKNVLKQNILLPLKFPHFFQGLRSPSKGILLVGVSGTGKSVLANTVGSKFGEAYITITPSLFSAKYVGREKELLRSVFKIVRKNVHSLLFIDEIEKISSILSMDILRYIELVNQEGKKMFLIGATSNPFLINDLWLPVFDKKIFVPLPCELSIIKLIKKNVKNIEMDPLFNFEKVSQNLGGYSCSEVILVCKKACLFPLQNMLTENSFKNVEEITEDDFNRPITELDFLNAQRLIKKCTQNNEDLDNWVAAFNAI